MIDYAAQTDLNELAILLGAIFTAFGGLLVGFYKYAQAREKDFERSRVNQTNAFDRTIAKLADSIDASTKAHKDVAKQTKRAADQAEKRNGHLAELQIEARDDVLKAINSIKTQNVHEQVVKHQTVEEKE